MEKQANYTLVGLTAIGLIIAFIALVLWMTIGWNHQVYNTYRVYMSQAVTGLNSESPVQFNGVMVGKVSHIMLNPKNPQQVELALSIKEGTPVTTSTVATLAAQGITGISYVALSAKSPNATLLLPTKADPEPVIPSAPSFFMQLDAFLKDTSSSMQTLLSPANMQNMAQILQDIRVMTDAMAQNAPAVGGLLTQAQTTLNSMNNLSAQGQASLNSFNALLIRLNAMSASIQQLSESVEQNPAVLIRGQAPLQPGPGE